MIVGLILDVLAALSGAVGMLCLLVWLFERTAPIAPYAEPFHLDVERGASDAETQEDLIPMPRNIKSHGEMVAWMTKELPRLTAEAATQRGSSN